ncbi:tetratricopeptide repeat protein [Arthrobacter sp. NPDC090010]|uniref:tetratricopeptide repeat protein n=1 Tax=Arthrobacter sp. NPDC090010 TaxID=3363942 RepID=UPI00382DF272
MTIDADLLAFVRVLSDGGDDDQAVRILEASFENLDPAPDEPAALLYAEAMALLIRLGTTPENYSVVPERLSLLASLLQNHRTPSVREAFALTELDAIEWVHGTEPDAIVMVDVLRAAESFAERYSAPEEMPGIRRARAEATLTACLLARHLGREESEVALGFESLAISLTGEADTRMRVLRLHALLEASRIRLGLDDERPQSLELLRRVIDEAVTLPEARVLLHRAAILLAETERDVETLRHIADVVLALPLMEDSPGGFALQTSFLDEILALFPDELREAESEARFRSLIDRFAVHPDDAIRDALLWAALLRYGRQGEASSRTATALRLLSHLDAAVSRDESSVTAPARLRIRARRAETTAALGDPAGAIVLAEELIKRFPTAEHDARLRGPFATAELERALRLNDLGRRDDALRLLGSIPARFAADRELPEASHVIAQALYWEGRFLREAGRMTESQASVETVLRRFATAEEGELRVPAANALFSLWQSSDVTGSEQAAARQRFQELFAEDSEPHIRGLDARRLLVQAAHEAEDGDKATAVATLEALLARHDESQDPDVQDTVRLARENLGILRVPVLSEGGAEARNRYRELRERLHDAEEAMAGNRMEYAEAGLLGVSEEAAKSTDPTTVLLGLAALDVLGGLLEDAARWEELSIIAARAAQTRDGLDTRAARVNARARLRLARAHQELGNTASALEIYEDLDRFAADSQDGDIVSARETALYNRAILLDDMGDVHTALAAYDRLLWAQQSAVTSAERRLRAVKALRNKSLLLEQLALHGDAATAHRQVLDIAGSSPEPALLPRARLSAFALAGCFARLGDHRAAAETYAWIGSAGHLGFSREELRQAAGFAKLARREAKRQQR